MEEQRSVAYGSHTFQQQLDSLLDRLEEEEGFNIVCYGLEAESCRGFMSDLVESSGMSLHQVDAAQLESERGIETQGNIREIFDTTTGEPALIWFDNADVFFKKPLEEVEEGEDREKDDSALRPIDYLFERMDAFKGIVVLSISSEEHLARAQEEDVDLVVTV